MKERKGPKKVGLDFLATASKPLVLTVPAAGQSQFHHRDSWSVTGWLKVPEDKVLTCYGLSSQDAFDVAEKLFTSNLCKKIQRIHIWRETSRGPWMREVFDDLECWNVSSLREERLK